MTVFSRNPNKDWDQLLRAAKSARLPYDRDMWLNLAFYLDEQYAEWHSDASTIRHIPRQAGFEHAPRPVQNKIMHFVLQNHSSALKDRPTADVQPATDDPMDVSDAAVSLAYLRWLFDAQNVDYDARLSEATLWSMVAGEGYLKSTFNPRTGLGEVVAPSPFTVYPDPYATTFKDCRYVFHSQFMDVEQVYDIYGKEVKPNQVEKADIIKAQLMREMGQAPVLSGATVNELWMKPSRRYPEGVFVVWTGNDSLIEPDKLPYEHKHLPFVQIGSVPRPGTPHYSSPVKYLRAPQMELNKYHAQRITVRENFSNPKWWIDSALELEQDPDNSPNQILRGNSQGGTLKPELLMPTSMPGGDEGGFIVEEMMHTAGLHEVSQAQVPGRVESSKAIALLRESDDDRLAELHRTIKSATTEMAWQQLELARQYVKTEIIVATYSKDGIPEVKKFKGEHAKPGQRVRVTMGTGLARSRAAKEEQVYRMVELGIISDPQVVAELLDVPVGTISPSKAADIRLARNENLTIAAGDAVKPNSWDDHAIHLREHNNYRKTQDYLMADDEVKQKFEYHCQTHEDLELEMLQKAAAKQQLLMAAQAPQEAGGEAPPTEE